MSHAKKNPTLGVVTLPPNPPELVSDEVQYIGYRHATDGELYQHDFGKGVELAADGGELRISHPRGRDLHRDFSGQTFLVNPPRGKRPMARRAQPRHRSGPLKGKFKKRGGSTPKGRSKKRNPHRAASSAPKSYSKPRRRNPPRITARAMIKSLTDGSMDAGLVLTGKAAVRTIPIMANLPKEGNVGLAVQAMTAVVIGLVAGRMLSPMRARMILAGGLTGPLETLIVAYNVPFLAPALSPVEGDAQMGAYMEGYVEVPVIESVAGVGGYADDLGMYDPAVMA